MLGHGEKLTRKQDLAIAALLEMPTITSAAKAAGVSEQTLWRWMQQTDFQEHYRMAKRRVVEQAITRLQGVTGQAVSTLQEIMINTNFSPTPRVLAARTILEFSLKAVELEDLAARVEELERRLEPETPPGSGGGAYLPNFARHRNGGG